MSIFNSIKYTIGRKVASVQRNIPWPVKKEVLTFPPLPSGKGTRSLIVLTHRRAWLESLWCCYSWMRLLSGKFHLTLYVDGGEIPLAFSEAFAKIFPGGHIKRVDQVCLPSEILSEDLRTFIDKDIYGPKLSLILESQRHNDILYSDSDILAFRFPQELVGADQNSIPPAVYNYEKHAGWDPWIEQRAQALGLHMTPGFNSGLLWLPQNSLDLDLASKLIYGWRKSNCNIWVEQGLFNCLASKAAAIPLPPEEYSVSWQGMWFWQKDISYENICVRHFCGVVRHLLFLKGMPYLKQLIRTDSDRHRDNNYDSCGRNLPK